MTTAWEKCLSVIAGLLQKGFYVRHIKQSVGVEAPLHDYIIPVQRGTLRLALIEMQLCGLGDHPWLSMSSCPILVERALWTYLKSSYHRRGRHLQQSGQPYRRQVPPLKFILLLLRKGSETLYPQRTPSARLNLELR